MLESIPGQHELEADNLLKGVESLERKLKSKQGDIGAISDFLRAAFKVENRAQLNAQLMAIEDTLRAEGINPVIEFHHRSSKYKGLHIQFNYNGVASEIQLHTSKSWGIKKELDPIYHITRDPQALAKLSYEEVVALKKQSQQIAQDLDLDISDLTSYAVKSFNAQNSEKSVLVRKSPTLGNDTQDSLEKSNSKLFSSEVDTAYNRPDSALSENSSLSGDSGNIQTAKADSTTTPLKIEANPAFGENFAEYAGKGAEAVKKLLEEKRGQVSGAFYRQDLGYIDLVWGDSKKGLAHILERRTAQHGEPQALEFIHNLPRILQEARFYREIEDKIELVTTTDMIVLGKRGDNKFVLTSFRDRRSKGRFDNLGNPQTGDDVGFTGKSVSEPKADDVLLPNQAKDTTTPLKAITQRTQDLSPQEIKSHIEGWDLSPKANANHKQRLRVSKIDPIEAQELAKAFKFKGIRDLVREIDAHQVLHALSEHGDEAKEARRGQIAITLEDIAHYQEYIKNPDFKSVQDNGRIVYGKQINGHAVVIEEALIGQDKLRFFDMWKLKGALNEKVLLAHSQRPNTTPSLDLEGRMPSSESDSTTTPLKKQTTAQGKNYLKSLSPEELKKAEDETYQDLSLLATKPLSTTPLTKEQLFKELKGYKHFGHDFTEFRDKGLEALELIAKKKHGQVSGAYYRADLGAIDIGYQLPLSNNTQRPRVVLMCLLRFCPFWLRAWWLLAVLEWLLAYCSFFVL
ncbi:hypothetical protein HAL07_09610 [Helicobacter ailurogastricus]|uniref:Phage-Barnase-EndoU-ColicinE5/D-RelE like nuclease 3 domain-containing protein n=1 Tax=Helicobacter ailurogastricus TaxID=1578720 RepID=A0A0K2XZH7_9HELI|nr:hypothetical protein HAL07_09610 [Helicobacter ailurogastricus]